MDDGNYIDILRHEIPAIRQAFNSKFFIYHLSYRIRLLLEKYGDKTNHPLLTLIHVRKRHDTRFFIYQPDGDPLQTESNRTIETTANMSIGCVIDTTIVHPYEHDFYLNSHNADRGVNNPALYHVLLNEIGFTADELQLLTYHLCYTDPRSSSSEAVPSVVHQASVAVSNARDLFNSDHT